MLRGIRPRAVYCLNNCPLGIMLLVRSAAAISVSVGLTKAPDVEPQDLLPDRRGHGHHHGHGGVRWGGHGGGLGYTC